MNMVHRRRVEVEVKVQVLLVFVQVGSEMTSKAKKGRDILEASFRQRMCSWGGLSQGLGARALSRVRTRSKRSTLAGDLSPTVEPG